MVRMKIRRVRQQFSSPHRGRCLIRSIRKAPTSYVGCVLFWLFSCMLLLVTSTTASASVDVRFARYPALSHDGQQVAFGWKGDLWVVSAEGGVARRLTSHPGYDSHPLWSSDSSKLAFVSHRDGSQDVYVMTASGGTPRRLTYHSATDTALSWLPQDKGLLIHSNRYIGVAHDYLLYQVGLNGSMPRPYLNVHASEAKLSPNGRYLVFARGSRRWWRKRWKGPYHPTLWLYDMQKKTFRRLTPASYSANSPAWINSKEIVFRSERTGTFNVWKLNVLTGQMMPYTHYRKTGVRYVHASRDGTRAVFARWDRLYRIELETGLIEEIKVKATGDSAENDLIRRTLRQGVQEYAVSPDQKEVALILHGDLFLKRFDDPDTWARRIASSPWRERQPAWSPNGRTLAFVSDRHDRRDSIYLLHAGQRKKRPVPLSETLAPKVTRLTTVPLKQPETSPSWSPNGKELAFLRGRGQLIVRSMPNGPERVVVSTWNLQKFSWSPDGRWFVFTRMDRESNTDVYLVRSHGKSSPINISRFPDADTDPVWSANGRVVAFLSRGISNSNGIRYAFLRQSDHEKTPVQLKRSCRRWAKQSKRNWLRRKKAARKRMQAARQRGSTTKASQRLAQADQSTRPSTRPVTRSTTRPARRIGRSAKRGKQRGKGRKGKGWVQVDLEELPFRLRFIPNIPGARGAQSLAISPDGCRFYVTTQGRGVSGLYQVDLWGRKIQRKAKGRVTAISVQPSGRLYYLHKGMLFALDGKGRKPARPTRLQAEVLIQPKTARLQMFTEGWRWLEQWFYDPKFHGIDWHAMGNKYQSLLPHVYTRPDFDDVVRMMLGELNASHLGIYPPRSKRHTGTGDLGVRFDWTHKGPGLKVLSVRPKGPASRRHSRLTPGDVILSVDGNAVSHRNNIHRFLQNVTHREVALRVRRNDGTTETIALTPVSLRQARVQRYRAWVEGNRKKVERWSGGRLGYAHIRAMGISSLDRFERDLFAHAYNKKGLVLDLRYNGGGWIADMMLTMFFPRPHGYTQWRGSRQGYPVFRRPFYTWHKPVILLINERSVSNAEIFAHAFRNLKRGLIVGMPTYGGVISTRNVRLLDGSYFRVPLRGWWTLPGRVNMENNPAQPHIVVPHTPDDEVQGRDRQMLRAAQVLLKSLTKRK